MNKAATGVLAALGALTLAAVTWFAGPLAPARAQAADTGATLSFDVRFSPFFLLDFRADVAPGAAGDRQVLVRGVGGGTLRGDLPLGQLHGHLAVDR